ncbi:hypothetical protein [Ureibacillus chungkukjangi]|uniref:Uncharacterized protein n=1 Tax=Ureibacillus chungkukjangi TaxID=1202712 RepID=A0A318TJH7_9BACL|nr:hypothetical protein [Ureibacillus chungkukjangi]PYF04007.1 hypothetical protein BJ095_12637 [Ureibacillus chungkukjangi]
MKKVAPKEGELARKRIKVRVKVEVARKVKKVASKEEELARKQTKVARKSGSSK